MSGVDFPPMPVDLPDAGAVKPPLIGRPRRQNPINRVLFGDRPEPEGLCAEDDPLAKNFPRAIVCGPISARLAGVDLRDSYTRHVEPPDSGIWEGQPRPENVWAQRVRLLVVTYEAEAVKSTWFRFSGKASLGTAEFGTEDFDRVCRDALLDAERTLSDRIENLVASALATTKAEE